MQVDACYEVSNEKGFKRRSEGTNPEGRGIREGSGEIKTNLDRVRKSKSRRVLGGILGRIRGGLRRDPMMKMVH